MADAQEIDELELCEREHCDGCRKLLSDEHGKTTAESMWFVGLGTYCKRCVTLGRAVDSLTGKPWRWVNQKG